MVLFNFSVQSNTPSFPMNLPSRDPKIWSPARSLEQESASLADNITKYTNFQQPPSVVRKIKKEAELIDPTKIFPVSFYDQFEIILGNFNGTKKSEAKTIKIHNLVINQKMKKFKKNLKKSDEKIRKV